MYSPQVLNHARYARHLPVLKDNFLSALLHHDREDDSILTLGVRGLPGKGALRGSPPDKLETLAEDPPREEGE